MTVLILLGVFAMAAQSRVVDPSALTIEQAIDEALRSEPALAAARAEIDAARGERRQAALRPNPAVMYEQREQAGGADRQTSITMELPLDLFRRGARIDAADRQVAVVEAAAGEAARQLAIAVRAQYGEVLEAQRRLEIAEEVRDASRRTHELLRRRVEEGAAPPLERDVAFVELGRMESARELAAGRVAAALAAMKRLLGRAADAPLALRLTLEAAAGAAAPPPPAPPDDRADVREAVAQAALASARTREARQAAKPDVGLFAGYMRMDQGFAQSGFSALGVLEPVHGLFHNVAAGVRVSIPVLDRGQGEVAAARARERAAAERVRAARLTAGSETSAASARVDAARQAAAAYSSEARALARRNLDVMRETYALGRVSLFDVLAEQRRYLEFESAYTDVLAELFAAVTALKGATGDLR
jgi:cobalt-zinc-cadmium efflux system outer membrane protein